MSYWDINLHDGPQQGTIVPLHGGPPHYGFLIEVPREVSKARRIGRWSRPAREVTDIYKAINHKTAVYRGTIR